MKVEKKQLSVPLMAHLEVTYSCNHRCLHCYKLDSKIENRPREKSNDKIVLENTQKLIDNGIIQIIITGGEPLLKKDLVKKIISLSKENNVTVSLNTNLTLLDDNFVEFLKQSETRILTSCPSSVSFDKLTLTGNYELFESNIKKIVAANLKLAVNMVVTKDNLHEIRATAEKIKELGCHSFCTTPMALNMEYPRLDLLLSAEDVRTVVDDLLWAERTLGLKVDILDGLPKCLFSDEILSKEHLFLYRRCQAGRTFIAVSCNGDVRPCANATVSYGNILEDELKIIWERMSDWRSMQYVPEKCKECTWLNRCLGGCRTNAKAFSGEWNGEDVWVAEPLRTPPPLHKKRIELKSNSKLQINHEYLYRQEYEDVFVVYNMKNNIYFMVNKAYFDLITRLKKCGIVTFNKLQELYNVGDENKAFFDAINALVQYKILKLIV